MRLDMFLKISRLIPRRALAQEFCDAGLIQVNGLTAKSGKEINVGDKVTINRRNRKTKVQIVSVPDGKQVSKQSAGDLFTVLSDESVESA
ncbi:MAG: S4 domain-containing protein [bacterium]|nr:S4 domain-containing protein [bacterium]